MRSRHFAAVNASVERFLSSDDVPMFAKRELLGLLDVCAKVRPTIARFDPDGSRMAGLILETVRGAWKSLVSIQLAIHGPRMTIVAAGIEVSGLLPHYVAEPSLFSWRVAEYLFDEKTLAEYKKSFK